MDNKRLKQISNQLSKELQNWDFEKAIKYSTDETNTRNFLIEPFFEILNYSKMDDYLHEYIADMGTSRGRRVDMAISFGKSEPVIFVECKKSDAYLNEKFFRQLNEYCLYTESVKIGILTNGINYDFYSRSSHSNTILNETPFFSFNLKEYTDSDLEKLALFYRNTFEIKSVMEYSEEVMFLSKFDDAFFETLANPEWDFLKIIYTNMGGKRLTNTVSNQLFELINSNSIQSVLSRIIAKERKDSDLGIITTSDEIKAFNIIKTMIIMSSKIKDSEADRITYRDFKGSFAIIVDGSIRKKICSIMLDKNLIEINGQNYELKSASISSLKDYKKELVNSALSNLK
ncbi:type I restriction enzyme HsdR N-terminal domain-containing protein [bacterium]|nr:type I restriction enzyme HsdR N-terminal domain-containing protein [bacterium]